MKSSIRRLAPSAGAPRYPGALLRSAAFAVAVLVLSPAAAVPQDPPAPPPEPAAAPQGEGGEASAVSDPADPTVEGVPDEQGEALLDLGRLSAGAGADLAMGLRAQPLQGMPATRAALILGGSEGGQISLAPLAFPVLVPPPSAGAEARAAVVLLLEVDGASLLGPDPALEPVVEIYAYALRPDNTVAGFLSQSLPLDLAGVGESLFEAGLKFSGHLELPPGEYSLRILVYETASQRFGLGQAAVTVPQRASLLAPLVPEVADAPWLLAGEAPHGSMGALDLGRVLELGGISMPSALPLLRGSATPVDLLLYGAAGARLPESLEVRGRDGSGQALVPMQAPVVERVETGLPGLERLRVELPLDPLPQGSYFLSFVAPGLGGGEAASADLAAVVLKGESVAGLWSDIQRRLAGEAAPSVDFEELEKRRWGRQKRVREAVAAAYLQVLERLASGDRGGALAGLVQVEREVLTSGQEAPLRLLQEAQQEVLGAVEAVAPAALLPVALLHGRAYEVYRTELDFGLSTQARERAASLAERFARGVDEEAADRLASAALASLGAYLQTSQVRTTGQALLRRALELDRENRFALIHLAIGLEKTGRYDEAIDVLRQLVEVDPKTGEGRLRMAVNLRRLGDEGQAEQWLRRLVGEVNEDWVLAVAYQELARLLLHRDRPADAVAVLEQGIGRLPAEGRLRLLLAYALDRAGQPRPAQEALARLAPSPGRESPRHRYNEWPPVESGESDQPLQEAALVRLPVLRDAVQRIPRTGEEDLADWAEQQRRARSNGRNGGGA